MKARQFFSESYAEARQKFSDACNAAGVHVQCFVNPARGPSGERLATDVALLGEDGAERLLVTISATHGGEGYCGSGIQSAWLDSGLWHALPAGTAVLMIHAINPYGFAWMRRVTEGNIDLNRNFPDFTRPLPDNPGYDELHEWLCPLQWNSETLAAANTRMATFREKHGAHALQAAITGGQYRHADGIFYGGAEPTWSHRLLADLFRRHAQSARKIAVIDYHTGLGPFGHGERICPHPPASEAAKRVRDWYGDDVTNPADGSSSSANLVGTNCDGITREVAGPDYTWIALEYGTRPLDEVLTALRADNWLHLNGDPDGPTGRRIKQEMRRCFYPDDPVWKEMVWERAVETQDLALRGLAEG